MKTRKPDAVEKTFHLCGWLVAVCYFGAFAQLFQWPGEPPKTVKLETLMVLPMLACPVLGLIGFGWAVLGLYRHFRDR